jgi:hypothetical protein
MASKTRNWSKDIKSNLAVYNEPQSSRLLFNDKLSELSLVPSSNNEMKTTYSA